MNLTLAELLERMWHFNNQFITTLRIALAKDLLAGSTLELLKLLIVSVYMMRLIFLLFLRRIQDLVQKNIEISLYIKPINNN